MHFCVVCKYIQIATWACVWSWITDENYTHDRRQDRSLRCFPCRVLPSNQCAHLFIWWSKSYVHPRSLSFTSLLYFKIRTSPMHDTLSNFFLKTNSLQSTEPSLIFQMVCHKNRVFATHNLHSLKPNCLFDIMMSLSSTPTHCFLIIPSGILHNALVNETGL